MDPLAAIRETFFQECEEQLAELETGLLAMETGDRDPETVNAVFRAVHSIKGGAGAFGLDPLVRFAHAFETVMDEMRSGRVAVEDRVLKILLRAADLLADHVRAAREGGEVDEARSLTVAAELAPYAPDAPAEDEGMADLDFMPLQLDLAEFDAPAGAGLRSWSVQFKPARALYAHANEASLLLRELQRLGAITVSLVPVALPGLAALDPDEAYLAWDIVLQTEASEEAIRDVFEFVDGDCDLAIRALDQPAAPQDDVDIAALIARAQEAAARFDPPPAAPVAAPATRSEPAPAASPTIRVDLDRVDRLINLVGELVINQSMLAQRIDAASLTRANDISLGLDDLEQLTREIQDSVMAIRAQPVKSVFQRMPRLVREVAALTGKEVRLLTEGEATEVDKTVIERLTDPITHMIRNAIDHGLESPQARIAAGKPAEGLVKLTAAHRGGRIVIEIKDDGAGIDRPRVRAIAIDKGLIAADAHLTDDEIDNLIFMPGFSTASAISDISGRGVGMDVVKRSIQALGGRIAIASTPGAGSTFTLSLPLTLAVLDGMVVGLCGQTFVAPLSGIVETLQPKPGEVRRLGANVNLIGIRDVYVPLIDVGVALGYRAVAIDPAEGVALLIELETGARAALLVDAIHGQRQVVIKSLEANYRHIVGIAAATILGDGQVALILDVDAIVSGRGDTLRGDPAPALAIAG